MTFESMARFHSSKREVVKSVPHLPTWEILYRFIFSLLTKLDQAPPDILCVWKTLINQSLSAFVFLLPSPCLTRADARDLSHGSNSFIPFGPQRFFFAFILFIREMIFESNLG